MLVQPISKYTFRNEIDAKRAEEIVKIFNVTAEIGKDLRYHFLTDQVCDCLGIVNYFDVVHPDCSQHKSTMLQLALRNELCRSELGMWNLQTHKSRRAPIRCTACCICF